MKFVNKNYYEILDVEPDASEEEIKRAYQLVRGTWNPDSIAVYSLYTPEENDAIGHKIEEAFHILSNVERRASYDRFLREVDRLPDTIETPSEFWDFAHGIAPPAEEDLEDVTDLLADADALGEEVQEGVLLEAVGGEARGFRPVPSTPEQRGSSGVETSPSRSDPPAERGSADVGGTPGTRQETSPSASVRPVSQPSPRLEAPSVPRPAGESPRRPREGVARSEVARPRPRRSGSVPPAPPAPPAGASRPAQPAIGDVRKHGLDADSGRPAARSGAKAHGSQRSDASETGGTTRSWTRSFARPLRVPPPLPDRPVPADMMDRLIAEHGYSGAFLQSIREFKEIRLEDISDRTKIQKTYLRCIEEERFDALPARVYVEGFVTQYAKLLRLDAREVAEGYMERYDLKTAPRPIQDTGPDDT